MERKSFFSAIVLILAVAFSIANSQCADPEYKPGAHIHPGKGQTLSDEAVAANMRCDVFVRCLEKFQHIKIDPNLPDSGLNFYVPWPYQVKIVEREMGIEKSQPAAKKAACRVSRFWIKKFATRALHDKYYMDRYILLPGENIFSVARRCARNPQVLVWFNGFRDPENLPAGQKVDIPLPQFHFWINEGVAPYDSLPLEDALEACDFPDTVKSLMLVQMQNNNYTDGYIADGQVLRTMASAPLNTRGKKRAETENNVVACFNNGVAYHAPCLKVVYNDSLYIGAVPDVCHNFSTWVEAPPKQKAPPVVLTIPTPVKPTPPPEDSGWGDTSSTSPGQDTAVNQTIDRGTPPPIEDEPIFNRNMLNLWGGVYSPLPYWTDMMEYLGGRLALYIPPRDGDVFALGVDVALNSWNGFGPRPERFRFAGIKPSAGVALDWLTEKSRFSTFLNYSVQIDWGWDGSNIVDTNQYHGRQLSQLINPSLAWIGTTASDWSWWMGWWIDACFDMNNIAPGYDHKVSDVGGVGLYQYQDPLTDKSSVDLGFYVFYWDISTKTTSLVLGTGGKGLHLWEDNRYEAEVDELLDIQHWWQFGLGYKYTLNSIYKKQNGPSFVVYFNASLLDIGKYKKSN
jgi:hypothetical protein